MLTLKLGVSWFPRQPTPTTMTTNTEFSREDMRALWDKMSDDLSAFSHELGLEDEHDTAANELTVAEMINNGLTETEAGILLFAISESAYGTIKTAEQSLYWALN